jgi:putative transposase
VLSVSWENSLFTVVTFARQRFLTADAVRPLLRQAITEVRGERPFEVVAWVLLPDHLHAVWTLPRGDDAYSLRWAQIKEKSTKSYLAAGGVEGVRTRSRPRHRERAVWQRRFWEHTVADENDLAA